jgi:dTDP-glucose 4,6-dehydratase
MSDYSDPVNIGNPEEITILEFAEEIVRLTGSKSKIECKPLPEDDPKVRRPDLTRANAILDWNPTVSRSEGLGITLEYFQKKVADSK